MSYSKSRVFCGGWFSLLPLHLPSVMAPYLFAVQEVSEADFSDANLNYQSTVGLLDSSLYEDFILE